MSLVFGVSSSVRNPLSIGGGQFIGSDGEFWKYTLSRGCKSGKEGLVAGGLNLKLRVCSGAEPCRPADWSGWSCEWSIVFVGIFLNRTGKRCCELKCGYGDQLGDPW